MLLAGTAPLASQPSAMALAMFPNPMKPILASFTFMPKTNLVVRSSREPALAWGRPYTYADILLARPSKVRSR